MEAETQIQPPAKPEIVLQGDSDESKSKRGGKRPGAGRKPNLSKRLLKGFSREAIAAAVADVDCGQVITGLLKSKRERTRLEALVYIRDLLIGRPAQNVQLSGGVIHAHTVWRPLANLSDDEMHALDAITKKLTAPAASEALPDSPHNQTESKPAIEAEVT